MSTLLKWAQNTQIKLNNKNTNGTNNNNTTTANNNANDRKWIHPPDTLQKGHIAYLVKFLGNIVVDQPKGIDVVKEGIRKLKFNQQLRKSESNSFKTKKVELTISIDGVAIQEPKTHIILHQFPLHRISYCADDKGEKKFFSFIAKQPNQVDNEAEDSHECFVFISDKLAEEITLTIGQAFELAYKRFLETSGRDLESQRRAMITQQKLKRLEQENSIYKQRLLEITRFNNIKLELDQYLRRNDLKNILEIPLNNNDLLGTAQNGLNSQNDNVKTSLLIDSSAPPIPPRLFENNTPSVGTKLENLLLAEFDQDFDPRSFENSNGNNANPPPLLAPPPKAAKRTNVSLNEPKTMGQNLFGTGAVNNKSAIDPFEMGDFSTVATSQDIENAIGLLDKRIMEMKTGFSRGISFGNDDFSLESLDPLKN